MTQDLLNHLMSHRSDLLSLLTLWLCSAAEVAGQKKGAKQKLSHKEYVRMRENNRLQQTLIQTQYFRLSASLRQLQLLQ